MDGFVIAVAGGPGCGKSPLSYGLKDRFPDIIEVQDYDNTQIPDRTIKKLQDLNVL